MRYEAKGTKIYREANKMIQKAMKKAKEDWIETQCKEIETCLQDSILAGEGSNFRERLQIQDRSGKCLTEQTLSRWTEYCSELYNLDSGVTMHCWTAVSP